MAEFPVAIITDEFTQDFEYICETAVRMSIPALEIRTAWNKNRGVCTLLPATPYLVVG